MKIIGLTGGISSGKSTVSSKLKELDRINRESNPNLIPIEIIDCDKIAR